MGTTFSKYYRVIGLYPKTVNGFAIGVIENFLSPLHPSKSTFLHRSQQMLGGFVQGGLYSVFEFLYLDTCLSMVAN
jgi:hypothetical protein